MSRHPGDLPGDDQHERAHRLCAINQLRLRRYSASLVRHAGNVSSASQSMTADTSTRKSITVDDTPIGDDEVAALTAVLGELTSMGLVEQVGNRVHLTPKGRAMLIKVRERLR